MTKPVSIAHFSDVLCVWAYVAQIRMDELKEQFGNDVAIEHHFIPLFGCTENRIGEGWKARGGYSGFAEHVEHVCEAFPHLSLHPDLWTKVRPKTSAVAHCYIKAVQSLEKSGVVSADSLAEFSGRSLVEEFVWRVRVAFFAEGKDISSYEVLSAIAKSLSLNTGLIDDKLKTGEAMAALCRDAERRDQFKIEGSPTYVLNEGRQKLYGNVGYKILEANVLEVLNGKNSELASWC